MAAEPGNVRDGDAAAAAGRRTADEAGGRRRVVLVDDNELTLDAFASALRSRAEIELVAAFGHADALEADVDWAAIDVVLLDAADEGRRGDQFPGVRVVRHVRAHQGGGRPTVVVVTGHFLHDGLRHRMAEADADLFFLRAEIRSADALADVVLHPGSYRRQGVPPVIDRVSRRSAGITAGTDIERAIDYVERQGLEGTLGRDPSGDPVPRRALFRHRLALGHDCGITAVNSTTGQPPPAHDTGGQLWPSVRQLRRVWAWAARVAYTTEDEQRDRR